MSQAPIRLIKPILALQAEFQAMLEEYRQAHESYHPKDIKQTGFKAYLRQLDEMARGVNLSPGIVPMTSFWLVKNNQTILGESRLRHYLTPALEIEGGHIGYVIRPSQRRKGYGTLILKLTLEEARRHGIERVRITCDTDNVASAHIIEKNGGVLSGKSISTRSGKFISQYWIEL